MESVYSMHCTKTPNAWVEEIKLEERERETGRDSGNTKNVSEKAQQRALDMQYKCDLKVALYKTQNVLG